VQAAPVKAAPVQAAPVKAAPVQAAPVKAAPVQAAPNPAVQSQAQAFEAFKARQAAPVQAAPVQAAPVQAAPAQAAPNPAAQSQARAFEAFKARQAGVAPTSGTTAPQPATIGTKMSPQQAAPVAPASSQSPAGELIGAKQPAPAVAPAPANTAPAQVAPANPAAAKPEGAAAPDERNGIDKVRDFIKNKPLTAAGGALAAGAVGSRMVGGNVNIKAASIQRYTKHADGMSHVLNTVKAEFPGVEGILRHSKSIHAGHAAQAGDPLREALPAAYTGLGLGALKATATVGSLAHIGSKLVPNRKQEAPPMNPPVGYDLPDNYGTPNPAFGEKVAGLFLRTSDLGNNPTDIINALDERLTNGGKSFRKTAAEESLLSRVAANPRVQGAVAGAAIAAAAELVDLKLLSPVKTPEPLKPDANYFDRMKHTMQESRYNIDKESRTNAAASAALAGGFGAIAGYRYGPEAVDAVKHLAKRLGGSPVETP